MGLSRSSNRDAVNHGGLSCIPPPTLPSIAQMAKDHASVSRNKSTGSLLSLYTQFDPQPGQTPTISPVTSGPSGLRRIRQSVSAASPSRPGPPSRSLSMHNSGLAVNSGLPPSPQATEDLSRFSSESLHSFSFTRPSAGDDASFRRRLIQRTYDLFNSKPDISPLTPDPPQRIASISEDKECPLGLSSSLVPDSTDIVDQSPSNTPGSATLIRQYPGSISLSSSKSAVSLTSGFLQKVPKELHDNASKCDAFVPPLKSTFSGVNLSASISSLAQPAHGNGPRSVPTAQAILATESHYPWVITSANDHASFMFGVTESDVRNLSVLELIQPHRHQWLRSLIEPPRPGKPSSKHDSVLDFNDEDLPKFEEEPKPITSAFGNGITARLLSKPTSFKPSRRLQALKAAQKPVEPEETTNHQEHRRAGSRGVLVCGDVVSIQKRNGGLCTVTLWVKEKHGGLIWVLEEIHEDVSVISVDGSGLVDFLWGASKEVWGLERVRAGTDVRKLIPAIPKQPYTNTGRLDWSAIENERFYSAQATDQVPVPVTIEEIEPEVALNMMELPPWTSPNGSVRKQPSLCPGSRLIRVSSYPNIAGIMIVNAETLEITSSNSAFASALFGRNLPAGLHIKELIPHFKDLVEIVLGDMDEEITDGLVIPSPRFREARVMLDQNSGRSQVLNPAAILFNSAAIEARHKDGVELLVDLQVRVMKSKRTSDIEGTRFSHHPRSISFDINSAEEDDLVYAVWVTYSREAHNSALKERRSLPPKSLAANTREEAVSVVPVTEHVPRKFGESSFVGPIKTAKSTARPEKRTINDFDILENMGEGAYGQVKLCREKTTNERVVIKYVTKSRILVDTWTRDRRLGTVPSEIHILDFLNQEGMRHPNIVEMVDFFEDDGFYYIEMVPHGIPGIDLFDYIEYKSDMDEDECRRIFVQVAHAVEHLHNKALVTHRDIKDENVILDQSGSVKLIDFGSAAYLKSGPFEVFVGTIDYAAPEVLGGKPYDGKEQDVWALGILLYTIIYKENPFYNVDEIMDHSLRVPYIVSDSSIELIRKMLSRDVKNRATITDVLAHPWCQQDAIELRGLV